MPKSLTRALYRRVNQLKIFVQVVLLSIRYKVIVSTGALAVLFTLLYTALDFANLSSRRLTNTLQGLVGWGLRHAAMTLLVLLVVLVVAAIVMYEMKRRAFGYQKLSLTEQKLIQQQLTLDPAMQAGGYGLHAFTHDDRAEVYITSPAVNAHLRQHAITLTPAELGYRIPAGMVDYVPALLRRKLISPGVVFNGHILGLASELFPDTDSLQVREVRYFESQVTDEVVYYTLQNRRDLTAARNGFDLFTTGSGLTREVFPLSHNANTNYLGVSTLLLTADHHVVLQVQGAKSNVNANNYAPSGSGSVEFSDWHEGDTLAATLTRAVERELIEELGLAHRDNTDLGLTTQLIGYARLFERGGKPDFFMVTHTAATLAELRTILDTEAKIDLAELDLSDNDEDTPAYADLHGLRAVLSAEYARAQGRGQSVQNIILRDMLTAADLADVISDRGNRVNEDFVAVGPDHGFLLDGASGLTDRVFTAGGSDAQLFSHTVGQTLREADWTQPLTDVLTAAVQTFAATHPWPADRAADLPSATFAAYRAVGDQLELAWLGDSPITVFTRDGRTTTYRDPTIGTNDQVAIDQYGAALQAGESVDAALAAVQPVLAANRARRNTTGPGGYWILDPTGAGIAHLHTATVPLAEVAAVMLASDGWYRLVDVFGESLTTPPTDLPASVARLRRLERAADSMRQYPRLKVSDDASAVVTRF